MALWLVDQFTYLGSNILSTESDVNICLGKGWNAIDSLSIIWKSGLFDGITRILLSCGCVKTTMWLHHINTNERHSEKARWKLHKNATCFEYILRATLQKTAFVRPPTSNLISHHELDMLDTAGEVSIHL